MKTNPISPKVIVVAVLGIILTSLASNAGSIDPHAFDFLGPWKLFVLGNVLTLIVTLAAWWKTDPLRVLPGDEPKADVAPTAPATIIVKPVNPIPAPPAAPPTVPAEPPTPTI